MSVSLIHVRFKDKSLCVPCDASTDSVSAVKSKIALSAGIPEFRQILVFDGKVLANTQSLASIGITNGSKVFLVEVPSNFRIEVRGPHGVTFLDVSATQTVADLKKQIEIEASVAADAQLLVGAGQILSDELTLAHYGIRPGVPLFLRIRRQEKNTRLTSLIDHLFDLMNDFITVSEGRQSEISNEIAEIVQNPQLIAYAKIHLGAAKLVDEARFMLEEYQAMSSERLDRAIAGVQDLMMLQFEACANGAYVMREALESDDSDEEEVVQQTKTDYEGGVSTEELPTCWGMFDRYEQGEKEFARQISVLKKMGFRDETLMKKALREASGNVPQAAKLIFHKFSHE